MKVLALVVLAFGLVCADSSDQDQAIKKALDNIYKTLDAINEDVKTGPSDKEITKLQEFYGAVEEGKKVGDKALDDIYEQMNKTNDEQTKEKLKAALEGAKQNWNKLIEAFDKTEQLVKERKDSFSPADQIVKRDVMGRLKQTDEYMEWAKGLLKKELDRIHE